MTPNSRLLSLGAKGSEVIDVQAKLLVLGFAVSPSERGRFGDETASCVISFQTKRGLAPDGIVGPQTYRELVDASHRLGSRMLYLRAPAFRGDDVRDIQIRLNALGFDAGKEDGILGTETEWAIKQFQRNSGLMADGIVARSTVDALGRLSRRIMPASKAALREKLSREALSADTRCVFLDPAHGGTDTGVATRSGLLESYIVFRVAEAAQLALSSDGFGCVTSRTSYGSTNAEQRASTANQQACSLAISFHFGCRPEPGPSIAYWSTGKSESESGRELADGIATSLETALGSQPNLIGRNFPFLRHTKMPAVVVDLKSTDSELLVAEDSYLANLGDCVAGAVSRWCALG